MPDLPDLRIDYGVVKDFQQVVGIEGAGRAFALGSAFDGFLLTQHADGQSQLRCVGPT